MASVPTGTTFHIASTIGTPAAFTSASNAAECVLTMADTTGFANGDLVIVASGWGNLNGRAFRLKSVVTNTSVTLEGMDTTNTALFPTPGTNAAGTIREITAQTQVTKVTGVSSSGGDPITVQYRYLESAVRYELNDGFNPVSYSINIDADSVAEAGYLALRTLTQTQTETVLRVRNRDGSFQLIPCKVSFNEVVQIQDGQINTVVAAFNGTGLATRYAS